jgi:hypothetical protein
MRWIRLRVESVFRCVICEVRKRERLRGRVGRMHHRPSLAPWRGVVVGIVFRAQEQSLNTHMSISIYVNMKSYMDCSRHNIVV